MAGARPVRTGLPSNGASLPAGRAAGAAGAARDVELRRLRRGTKTQSQVRTFASRARRCNVSTLQRWWCPVLDLGQVVQMQIIPLVDLEPLIVE